MTEELNRRVVDLFHRALEIPPSERARFLREECGEDARLEREVRELLDHDPGAESVPEASDADPDETLVATAGARRDVGPYKLLQRIGEGGMGTVWMAEQERPVRRRVALKLIRGGADSQQIVARFEAERQALALMDHQNIAKVLDAGTTEDGLPFFAMELVKGIPLNEYCDRNQLGIRDRLELLIPVCQAVQHAHQKGIVHRDLKPSNVLVALYDGRPVPKVIDFGLAKALDAERKLTDKTMFTEFGKVVGSVQYMSPEQAEMNALDVDARTDIYSLGVVLYELLTGSTPLDEETLREKAFLEVLEMIRSTEPPRPSTRISRSLETVGALSARRRIDPARLRQILRGELDWIVMRALEKDRTRRYQTANELAEDVQRYLKNEPINARPPSAVYRVRKFAARNRGPVLLSAAVLVLLLAALAVSTYLASWALRERANAETALRREELARQEILQLSDMKLLQFANAVADSLWPAFPDRIAELESWLVTYGSLKERLPDHRAALERLRESAVTSPSGNGSGGEWTFSNVKDDWRHDALVDLVDELKRFTDPDPHVGTIASVKDRLAQAREIERTSQRSESARAAWEKVIHEVRTSPRYRDSPIDLSPQIGLYPLGAGPSGLQEFLHLPTHRGPIPSRGSDGTIDLTPDLGVVLVLIPGGEVAVDEPSLDPGANLLDVPRPAEVLFVADDLLFARLGIREGDRVLELNGSAVSESGDIYEALWDAPGDSVTALVERDGRRVRRSLGRPGFRDLVHPSRVHVSPFLLSKYEMTQSQWVRLTGKNPSAYDGESGPGGPLHPVELVSARDADRELTRVGLRCPTLQEWILAAIGPGSEADWWTGDDPASLRGFANLADRAAARAGFSWATIDDWADFDDGWAIHSPVDAYPPNRNGLCGLHGNVFEWLADPYDDRGLSEDPSSPANLYRLRVGGSFYSPPEHASVWAAEYATPESRDDDGGVRPAWTLREPGDGARSDPAGTQ